MISQATLNEVREAVRVDGKLKVKVKGIDGPVAIYDIGGVNGEHNVFLPFSSGEFS